MNKSKAELVKIANYLDSIGLYIEADKIDRALYKSADLLTKERSVFSKLTKIFLAVEKFPYGVALSGEKVQGLRIPYIDEKVEGQTKERILKYIGVIAESVKKRLLLPKLKQHRETHIGKEIEKTIKYIDELIHTINMSVVGDEKRTMHSRIKRAIKEARDAFKMLSMFVKSSDKQEITPVQTEALELLRYMEWLVNSGGKESQVKEKIEKIRDIFDVEEDSLLAQAMYRSTQAEGSNKVLTEKEQRSLGKEIDNFAIKDTGYYTMEEGKLSPGSKGLQGFEMYHSYAPYRRSIETANNQLRIFTDMRSNFIDDMSTLVPTVLETEVPEVSMQESGLETLAIELQQFSVNYIQPSTGLSKEELEKANERALSLQNLSTSFSPSNYQSCGEKSFDPTRPKESTNRVLQDAHSLQNTIQKYQNLKIYEQGWTLVRYLGLVKYNNLFLLDSSTVNNEMLLLKTEIDKIKRNFQKVYQGLTDKEKKQKNLANNYLKRFEPVKQYRIELEKQFSIKKWKEKYIGRTFKIISTFYDKKKPIRTDRDKTIDNTIRSAFKQLLEAL